MRELDSVLAAPAEACCRYLWDSSWWDRIGTRDGMIGIRIVIRINAWRRGGSDGAHESRHARGDDGRPVADEEGGQGWDGGERGGDALCRAEGEGVCLGRGVFGADHEGFWGGVAYFLNF